MNGDVNLENLKMLYGNFWRWWLRELTGVYELLFCFRRGEPVQYQVDGDGRVALSDKTAGSKVNEHKVHLSVPEQHIMFREIRLPANAGANLRQVIEYEFDKYFPLPFSQVYTGNKVLHSVDEKSMNIGIWAVRKDYFDSVISRLETEYGANVKEVALVDATGDVLLKRDVANSGRTHKNNSAGKTIPYFRYVVAVLLMTGLLIPLFKMDNYSADLSLKVKRLEEQAKDVLAIRNEMSKIETRLGDVIEAKKSIPGMTKLWSGITQVVAGNGIVTTVIFRGKKVILEGKAVSVEKIVKLLESHTDFTNVSIDAPVRRLGKGKYESMRITFLVADAV